MTDDPDFEEMPQLAPLLEEPSRNSEIEELSMPQLSVAIEDDGSMETKQQTKLAGPVISPCNIEIRIQKRFKKLYLPSPRAKLFYVYCRQIKKYFLKSC